jgi:hypothetical protein
MRIPFFSDKKLRQSKSASIAPTLACAPASNSSAEVRQLTIEEYAAVAGGPEGEVGDGTVPS